MMFREPTANPHSVSWRGAWLFLLGALVVAAAARIALSFRLPLTGDEAYYWQWGRHLALGYHDHPPLIGWLLAGWRALGGDSAPWLRLLPLLASSGFTLFVFLAAATLTGSPAAACWSAAFTLTTPLLSLGGLALLPDTPLLFFWSLALFALSRALFSDHAALRWWGLAGIAMGGALLSKLTALLLPVILVLFLLLSRRHRERLATPGPYVALAVALLVAAPLLLWNAAHHWENFAYQYGHRAVRHVALPFKRVPGYLLLQALLVFTPILFWLAGSAWVRAAAEWWRTRNDRLLFLLVASGLVHGAVLLSAFVQRPGLHWSLPGTLPLFILLGAWFARWTTSRTGVLRIRKRALAGATLAVFSTAICYTLLFNPILALSAVQARTISTDLVRKGKKLESKELGEFLGYEKLGRRIREIHRSLSAGKPPLLLSNAYTLSSLLAYYSGEPAYVVLGSSVGGEYARWINFREHLGDDALYVDFLPIEERPDIAGRLTAAFESITPLPPIEIVTDGVVVRTVFVAHCRTLRRDLSTLP